MLDYQPGPTNMTHIHHIIPKYMGGTDDPENLYECSVEEHAELHFAAYLEQGRWQDYYAAMGLAGIIGKEEIVRAAQAYGGTISTQNRRSYAGDSNPFYGKSQAPEARESISKTLKEHYKQEGHPWSGRKHSEVSKAKMKGRVPWNKGKKMTDEHKKAISEGRRK
tara:strand:+ start:79 stop:573 length:495 start_codon:yes stop_codon:yes gene_type:complete